MRNRRTVRRSKPQSGGSFGNTSPFFSTEDWDEGSYFQGDRDRGNDYDPLLFDKERADKVGAGWRQPMELADLEKETRPRRGWGWWKPRRRRMREADFDRALAKQRTRRIVEGCSPKGAYECGSGYYGLPNERKDASGKIYCCPQGDSHLWFWDHPNSWWSRLGSWLRSWGGGGKSSKTKRRNRKKRGSKKRRDRKKGGSKTLKKSRKR